MVTRRNALKLGALAAVAVGVPLERFAGATPAEADAVVITVPSFTTPLRVPPVLRPTLRSSAGALYQLTMAEKRVQIFPGLSTTLRTFNGEFPGPTIKARRGEPIVVVQRNNLTVPAAVHLHGAHVPRASDGHPMDTIAPGGSRTYRYPNDQRGSLLWYHDHAHHMEAENVYRGLSGLYLLTDDYEEGLPLPKGDYDIPLAIRGAEFNADGGLIYNPDPSPDTATTLVNGRPAPYFRVAARKYRFRIANISNERTFTLALRDGAQLVQIGSDGGLLAAPVPTAVVALRASERADVIIDFSRYPVGSQVFLDNTTATVDGNADVIRFDVVRTAPDPSRIPDHFQPLPEYGNPVVQREFTLSYDAQNGIFLINGKPFDENRVDIKPKRGTTEVWTIRNPLTAIPIPHTFHTHLQQFRVLDRNGAPPTAVEAGLKDTVAVPAGDTVRIKIQFTKYTGRYVYHCHMMEHSGHSMMGQMEIQP